MPVKVEAELRRNGQFMFRERLEVDRVPVVGEEVFYNHAMWRVTAVAHGGSSFHAADIEAEWSRNYTQGLPGGR